MNSLAVSVKEIPAVTCVLSICRFFAMNSIKKNGGLLGKMLCSYDRILTTFNIRIIIRVVISAAKGKRNQVKRLTGFWNFCWMSFKKGEGASGKIKTNGFGEEVKRCKYFDKEFPSCISRTIFLGNGSEYKFSQILNRLRYIIKLVLKMWVSPIVSIKSSRKPKVFGPMFPWKPYSHGLKGPWKINNYRTSVF